MSFLTCRAAVDLRLVAHIFVRRAQARTLRNPTASQASSVACRAASQGRFFMCATQKKRIVALAATTTVQKSQKYIIGFAHRNYPCIPADDAMKTCMW